MKIQIENLKMLMHRDGLTMYQKALALREFNHLIAYVEKLEKQQDEN